MRILNIIYTTAFVLFSFLGFSQKGSLGNATVSVQNEWVNTYTSLTLNANAGATSIAVASNSLNGAYFTSNLAAGDLILIIQMQGAAVDINTTPTVIWGGSYTAQNSWTGFGGPNPDWDETEYGQVLNYNNAGNYEYVEVSGITGGTTINLNCALTKSYTAAGHVQVIRVPRFDNLTVQNNSSISCPQWSGTTGGVVAIEVAGDLSLNGTGQIEANENGFRGGLVDNLSSFTTSVGSLGFLGSSDIVEGSEKGEGIAGFYAEYDALFSRYCKGAVANGGGGGNFHNAGGGGGSNVGVGTYFGYGVPNLGPGNAYVPAWILDTSIDHTQPSAGGGRGGYSHATANLNPLTNAPNNTNWNGESRKFTFGFGGHALNYNIDKIFMGGGGGAGEQNDGDGGGGGRGGGMVMLTVYGNITGTGSINVNGQNGGNSQGPPPGFGANSGDDGAGGAGGGGSILIQNINAIPASVSLNAIGGNGGNQQLQVGAFGQNTMDGPGGGGAGGMISFSSGAPVQSVLGGSSGTSNSSIANNFPPNGATGGGAGMGNLSIPLFDLLAEDDTICGGGTANLSVSLIGSLPTGGTVEWYTSQFGGGSINSGTTFTTPVLGSNTTYWVGVCPGTFRIPINVLVSPAITITGTAVEQDESCAGNDGGITGLTAGGGFGALTFDWNGVVSPSEDLVNAVGGSYTLTVTDDNGCSETAGPFLLVASPGPSIDISNIQIDNETCNGNDGAITGITAAGSNITFEWNGNPSVDEDLTSVTGGSYTLIVTDDNSCQASAGPFTINTDNGPVIDISGIVVTEETCFGNNGAISGIVVTGSNVTYEWNGNPSATTDLNGVVAGSYTLVATDDNGCSTTEGPILIGTIPSPTIDVSNMIIQGENCNQLDGSITGIVASGNGLTFDWNGNPSPNEDLLNQAAGSYTLTVTDNIGCIVQSGPHVITSIGGPTIDDANLVINDATCALNNGEINGLVVTGSNPTFSWNGSPSPTLDLENLSPGTYSLTVLDDNGCSINYGPVEILDIPVPTIDDANLVVLDESCVGNDGVIQGLVVTGTGLVFSWNGDAAVSENAAGLAAGDYTLEVIDGNGCTLSYGPITVGGTPPPIIDVVPDNSVIDAGDNVTLNLSINPSSGSDVISWSPSTGLSCDDCSSPVASPSETTTYVVTVSNADGCIVTDTVTVIVNNPCGEIFVPTIFSPNSDDLNEQFCVLGGCIESISFEIFNRWGERVFKTESSEECWDGMFRGMPVNTGVFVYKAIGKRTDGTSFEEAGNVTIVN